jgi:DDE superfamily endonuclease
VAAVAEKTGGQPIEIWFGDEARIGQKNKITRRWAKPAKGSVEQSSMEWPAEGKRGTRPSAPRDQRPASAYIFGAICPRHGKGAALVRPSCNTEAMALHLEEIAAAVAPSAHAIPILDQAGWHVTKTLPVPPNMTLVSLPPKSSELNPVENIWQFMRDNWLSNRVFTSYPNIVDHCCPCLEQTRQPAMADHVHRNSPMGKQVMLMKTWC